MYSILVKIVYKLYCRCIYNKYSRRIIITQYTDHSTWQYEKTKNLIVNII